MSMSMSMSMSMAAGAGGPWPGAVFGATPGDLGYRPLTLQFALGTRGKPDFPLQPLPEAGWRWSEASWDADIVGLLTMLELKNTGWDQIVFPQELLQWRPSRAGHAAFVRNEIEQLGELMRQDRERYLAEIIAQHDGAPLYWLSLMGITESSKPASFRLVHMAVRIGETAVMFYKDMFRRPRPSEVCPGLMPPFGPPGHPAFPSGHSTQGHLISQLLAEVAPRYAAQLGWLADRVAINRERAGFHYRSDSDAGKFLAAEIFRRLMGSAPSGPVRYGDETDERRPRFRDTLEQARGEWA